MNLIESSTGYTITLSERNVEALLLKLDEPSSRRTLTKHIIDLERRFARELIVTSTEDTTLARDTGYVVHLLVSRADLTRLRDFGDTIAYDDEGERVARVIGQENEWHYDGVPAGQMHPREEARISRPSAGVI